MELNKTHKSIANSLLNLDYFNDDNDRMEKISFNKYNDKFNSNCENNHIFLICKNCYKIPEIIFIGWDNINIKCNCRHVLYSNNEYLVNNYSKKFSEQNLKEESFYKCQKHLMKSVAYCEDCSMELCEKCFDQNYESHLDHTILRYPNLDISKIACICENIRRDKNEKPDLILFDYLILNSYQKMRNFINYKNISNLLAYLSKYRDSSKEINNNKKKMEIYYKINRLKELKNIIKTDYDKINQIESINIQAQNFYDLNILKTNEPFISYNKLLNLDLRQNNISDISSLISINFPELKNLNLSTNRIGNESIDNIFELNKNCPKLEILDLSNNAFTEYKLFECCQTFSSLKTLNLGKNLLNTDFKMIQNEIIKYDFSNLNELDLSFGVFSKQSIDLMNNFKLDNILKLDLCSNNLNSLTFIKKLNCDKLEEILLADNHLKEFYILKKFKKLRLINLKGNHISNINNLNKFLKELPMMEKLILSKNKIDLNKTKNDEIIEGERSQRNSLNDKIQIII